MKIQWSKDEIQDSIVRKEKGDKVMWLKRETGEKKNGKKEWVTENSSELCFQYS